MPEFVGDYVGAARLDDKIFADRRVFRGSEVVLRDYVNIPAGAIGDIISLGMISTRSRMSVTSTMAIAAMGAGVLIDFGFRHKNITDAAEAAALAIALETDVDVSAALEYAPVDAIARADACKPLWQVAGLAENPGDEFEFIATIKGANPAANVDLFWELRWSE